jgi:hypothetical protein
MSAIIGSTYPHQRYTITAEIPDKPGRTLHDRIFKEFLHRFLPDFMGLFFPAEAARLDFTTLTFLDHELRINLPEQTLRVPEFVAEVSTLDGEREAILVHIEIEGRDRRSLPQRMFEYYSLLRILRQKKVLPLALVLQPQAGGLGWQVYQEMLFGRTLLEFHYGQVGLRDLHSEDYLGENPVGAALAALMQPDELHPAEVKLAGLQRIIHSDLTEGDKLFLIGVIETYLPREKLADAGEQIMQTLVNTELTWGEQHELKGKIEIVLRLLHRKFGPLPESFVQRLEAINNLEVVDELSDQVLTAVTLDDITLPE